MIELTSQDIEELIDRAEYYFKEVFNNRTGSGEIPLIVGMHNDFNKLKEEWEEFFRNKDQPFFMTSFFTHLYPQVKAEGNEPCEFGDLLYLHIHIDENGNSESNALLLQAKVTSTKYEIMKHRRISIKNGQGLNSLDLNFVS